MNRVLLAAVAAALVGGAAFAQGKAKAPAAPAQTTCPVMGDKLGANPTSVAYTGKLAEFKGKSIKVCCAGCTSAIKQNPDKYFKQVFAKK